MSLDLDAEKGNEMQSTNRYTLYKVVAQQSLGELEEAAENWMQRGYIPVGGLIINDVQTSIWYMQAMFHPGDEK